MPPAPTEHNAASQAAAPLRRALRLAGRALLWALCAVLAVEACSAVIVTAMNFAIYGKTREGSRIVYDSYTTYTAASGPRQTVQPEPTGERRVIWFFGGSTMRGENTSPENTLPSIISRELNKESPCECVNFGVNSFGSLQELRQLQKAQVERERWPDLIVFLDGANDCSYSILYDRADAHEGYARLKGFLESYWSSPLGILKPVAAASAASFTLELYSRLTYALREIGPDSALPAEVGQAMRARYDYADRIARASQASFLAVLQPVAWQEADAAIPEAQLARRLDMLPAMRGNFSRMYAGIAQTLSGRTYFLDLRTAFAGRTEACYEADGIHNTDHGREVLAQAMLPAIRQALARGAGFRPN